MGLLQAEGCEKVICLGDICGYYSMVNECIDLLRQEGVECIKGNHDTYILGEAECSRSKSVMDCIRYQREQITPENLEWVAGLGESIAFDDCLGVHGGLSDPIDEYVSEFDFDLARRLYPGVRDFFSGHTHIQQKQVDGDLIYCNPGSVGQPRDHDPRAACAILDDEGLRLQRIEYPIAKTAAAMAAAGFSDYYYRNLYKGFRIGERDEA